MQGRDISHLYLPCQKDDKLCRVSWRSEFYYEFPIQPLHASSALVRRDWKYITWRSRNYEQLFNLEYDPLEMNDLANHSRFEDLKEEMRARHDELRTAVMAPIIPGSQCDPLWPPGSDTRNVPACCCKNGTTVDLNEFTNV